MWRRIHTLMLEAPFLLIRAALPGMRERGFGRVLNLSSVHGLRASAFKSAYVAAKHGLEGLSKVTALEGAPHGVDLAQAVGDHLRDIGAAARQVGDEAGGLELAQRLAHRPLAGGELGDEAKLHQPLAGAVVAVEDAPQQRLLQPPAQRRDRLRSRPARVCLQDGLRHAFPKLPVDRRILNY